MRTAMLPLAQSPLVPAIVGLLGVVVGAAINGYFQRSIKRRDEAVELLSHTRLVAADLHGALSVVEQFMKGEMSDRAVWGDELASPAWVEGRGVLASGLKEKEWDTVRKAFDDIAGFRRGLLQPSSEDRSRFADERRGAQVTRDAIRDALRALAPGNSDEDES
jgi:hypothetical protein